MSTENVLYLLNALVVNVNPHNMITSRYSVIIWPDPFPGPNVKEKSGLGCETTLLSIRGGSYVPGK